MSHTLKRNLTGLGLERKKTLKLKTFISSLFHGKNREIWNVNSNKVFP